MSPKDAPLILEITKDTCLYLDNLQHQDRLWVDVENHIAASHIAESLGDVSLAARHLQTVTRLMEELYM